MREPAKNARAPRGEITEADLHAFTMPNGKHVDAPITRVPVGYLRWMVNENHSAADWARAELKRRGSVLPTLEISGHAIDRASLKCSWVWRKTRRDGEGLHAWLCRVAAEALEVGTRAEADPTRIEYADLSFRFDLDCVWPVLKTILPSKRPKKKPAGA